MRIVSLMIAAWLERAGHSQRATPGNRDFRCIHSSTRLARVLERPCCGGRRAIAAPATFSDVGIKLGTWLFRLDSRSVHTSGFLENLQVELVPGPVDLEVIRAFSLVAVELEAMGDLAKHHARDRAAASKGSPDVFGDKRTRAGVNLESIKAPAECVFDEKRLDAVETRVRAHGIFYSVIDRRERRHEVTSFLVDSPDLAGAIPSNVQRSLRSDRYAADLCVRNAGGVLGLDSLLQGSC